MEKPIINIQKLLIVALCKVSSAIIDIQEIEDEKMYKGNVKREINNFIKWYNDYSRPLSKLYYQTGAKYADTIVDQFNNYDTVFNNLPREADNRMCLAYAKLSSVIEDFNSVEFEDNNDIYYFGKILSEKTSILLTKGFWNQYINESAGEQGNAITLSFKMDHFGKKIYTEEDEQV